MLLTGAVQNALHRGGKGVKGGKPATRRAYLSERGVRIKVIIYIYIVYKAPYYSEYLGR